MTSAKQGSSKNLKFFSSGQSSSCPQTPTDIRGGSNLKEEIQEKSFQFRDAFHYYTEGNSPGRHPGVDKVHIVDRHQTGVKTRCAVPTNDLITALETDCSYIKNYKVIGSCDNIIIAKDVIINQLVAIKVILKPASDCGRKPFFPTGILYMVPLIRFHENSSCIFLVLKYIRKKNLNWNFAHTDRPQFKKINHKNGSYQGGNLLAAEIASELNGGQLRGDVLSSNVDDISVLSSNRYSIQQEIIPASCTCAVAVLDEGNKTLSDVSSDALSDISDFNCYERASDFIPVVEMDMQCFRTSDEWAEIYSNTMTHGQVVEENFIEKVATQTNQVETCLENEIMSHSGFHEECKSNTENLMKDIIDQRRIETHKGKLKTNRTYSLDLVEKSNMESDIDSHSVSLSVEDIIKNSRELLNRVTNTLEQSNNIGSETNFDLKQHKRRRESSGNLEHNNDSSWRPTYLNKSVSFDISEIRKPSAQPELTPASESTIKRWTSQVIVAIDGLHNHGIIWGDFNPSNVLFDENGHVMLTYKCFLPSTWVDSFKQHQGDSREKLMLDSYCAPELRNPLQEPTRASDWWSVGVLLYQLLTGKDISTVHPTGVTKYTEIDIPDDLSIHARLLLKHILRADPQDRLGYDGCMDLKLHPFFEGIMWPEEIT